MISSKSNVLAFIFLSLIIFFLFKDLPKTFYQQDEWFGLGLVMSEGIDSVFNGVSKPVDFLFVKGRILSSLINFLFANYFPLQNIQLAVFAMILHILATFLVFILIKRFLKSFLFALIGATFFAVNSVSQGAITWPAVASNTIGSTILVLLSILFFFNYLADSKPKWLISSGVIVYLSLWFKETGLYLFLFLPLSILIFKKYQIAIFLKKFWTFLVPFFLIVSYRLSELLFRQTSSNLYITGQNENFFSTILIRSILYPLTSFSLMFIPGDDFLAFARMVLRQIYPFFASSSQNILIAQTVILDLLAVILTLLILGVIFILLLKEKKDIQKRILFWLLFSLMSLVPYIVLSKDFSYLESRYYYLSVVGGSVVFAWVVKRLSNILNRRIFILLIVPFVGFYLFWHATAITKAIDEQVKISTVRKDFISQLKTLIPSLDNNKNVFYTTSDLNYWVDGNKIPFQQGSGYTFMVLYNESGKIPKNLLKTGFLFDIGSQGYSEIDGFGFGYFWDQKELDQATIKYKIPANSINKLYYDSKTKKLSKF